MPESPTSTSYSHCRCNVSDVACQIPGTIQVPGREFLYIETRSGQEFNQLMDLIFASCPTIPSPESGGVLGEKAWMTLPDDAVLFGISYKGDLDGWRRKVQGFCKESGRQFATPSDTGLLFPDGTTVPFSGCKVVLER